MGHKERGTMKLLPLFLPFLKGQETQLENKSTLSGGCQNGFGQEANFEVQGQFIR